MRVSEKKEISAVSSKNDVDDVCRERLTMCRGFEMSRLAGFRFRTHGYFRLKWDHHRRRRR
jgi:hypothetical protein